jgi:hypothetical protein
MPPLLFSKHLEQTKLLRESSTPFLDEEIETLENTVRTFAESYLNEPDDIDLGEFFESFVQYQEYSQWEAAILEGILIEATELATGEDATDENVKLFLESFVAQLAKPFPKATKTSPNREGLTPLEGEGGVKKFLRSLTVFKYPDPYGNDDSFSAKDVKVYDRVANRHGHPYSAANDWNNQKPDWPLANPILNVQGEGRAFEAVDSVGVGALIHWRVKNNLTGQYVTRQIHRESAIQIAAELNQDFLTSLHESIEDPNTSGQGHDPDHAGHALHATPVKNGWKYSHSTPIHQRDGGVSIHHTWKRGDHNVGAYHSSENWETHKGGSGHFTRGQGAAALDKHLKGKVRRMNEDEQLDEAPTRKDFQHVANTVRAIEDPKKRQEFADHHASIFARQNPRFDHARFHAACGTVHNNVQKENAPIASTPITEGIHQTLAPDKVAAVNAALKRQNVTMGGSLADSNYAPNSVVSDLKAAALLVEKRKARFNEDASVNSELESIHVKQHKDRKTR